MANGQDDGPRNPEKSGDFGDFARIFPHRRVKIIQRGLLVEFHLAL